MKHVELTSEELHWLRQLDATGATRPWIAGTEEYVDYGSVYSAPVFDKDLLTVTQAMIIDDLSPWPGTAELIAAAVNALPALLDAVAERDALRKEVDLLRVRDRSKYAIMFGHLVCDVGEHTCAGGGAESGYAHEPSCGFEPILRLDDLPGWPVPTMQEPTTEHFTIKEN